MDWVSPRQLREAATRLREAVEAALPEARIILETYERNANHISPEEFIRDLDNIIAITRWAGDKGAVRMTLEVNW